jgi:hypothetical protein
MPPHSKGTGDSRRKTYLLFLRPCVIVPLAVFNRCWFGPLAPNPKPVILKRTGEVR